VADTEVMFAGATVAIVGKTGSFLHPKKIITADRYSEISRTFKTLNFLFINFVITYSFKLNFLRIIVQTGKCLYAESIT